MRRSSKTSLKPYPNQLFLSFDGKELPDNILAETQFDSETGEITVVVKKSSLQLSSWRLTLVHEALHAVQFVEEFIQHELDKESAAYLLERIAQWLWEKCEDKASK